MLGTSRYMLIRSKCNKHLSGVLLKIVNGPMNKIR